MTEAPKTATGINGVWLQPLAIISVPGGPVLHLLKSGSPLCPDFPQNIGEIYFSEVEAGAVKAWKCHSRQSQLFAVPMGQIKIVLFDGREDSSSYRQKQELVLGRPANYNLLAIPPGVWYGFKGISVGPALICNCADLPHDPTEGRKLPLDSPLIPYHWD